MFKLFFSFLLLTVVSHSYSIEFEGPDNTIQIPKVQFEITSINYEKCGIAHYCTYFKDEHYFTRLVFVNSAWGDYYEYRGANGQLIFEHGVNSLEKPAVDADIKKAIKLLKTASSNCPITVFVDLEKEEITKVKIEKCNL